jgi:4-amino-4-deoxy-L-arabinose transferase-like glycosyltransferase
MPSVAISHPGRLVLALILVQFAVLVVFPTLFSNAPPLDVVEGLVWAPHWLIGTYKHPPLPAWLIEISVLATRNPILGPYVMAQLCMGLSYLFIYQLGKLLMDARRAAAGTLLMAGTYYFTVPTPEFNHNVVQIPLWAGTLWLFTLLRRDPLSWRYWLLFGVVGGVGLYGKYTFSILIVALIAIAFFDARMRTALATFKPYVASAMAIILFLPHMVWLVENNFEPFSYAIERADAGNASNPLTFLGAQLADHLPMLVVLVIVGVGTLRRAEPLKPLSSDLTYLRLITFLPLAILTVGFTFAGASLKTMWGMPMFTSIGLWVVFELKRPWSDTQLTRLTATACSVVTLVGIGFAIEAIHPYGNMPQRTNWPMKELSSKTVALWRSATDKPLLYVGGDAWTAGLVAVGMTPQPLVMIGTDAKRSPWLTLNDVKAKGVALVFQDDRSAPDFCGADAIKASVPLSEPFIAPATVIICPPQSTN